MSRQYTPEDIRNIGSNACPAIVESYDEVTPWAKQADAYKDRLFGTHENGPIWISLFDIFKDAVEQAPISIDAMGRALVAVADSYDEDEQDIVLELDTLMDEVEGHYNDQRETILEEKAEEERLDEATREAEEQAGMHGEQPT
ncbi:hypothetical protein [Glycomyces tenuis]|uniref:hypothetical protein n=1 Tax=Glycomyces tenuis TaxID=58116 RepID=UPI00040F96CE|nr:hypothetical protein [Glycomyces tenuis]